jgi:hypothetical protein
MAGIPVISRLLSALRGSPKKKPAPIAPKQDAVVTPKAAGATTGSILTSPATKTAVKLTANTPPEKLPSFDNAMYQIKRVDIDIYKNSGIKLINIDLVEKLNSLVAHLENANISPQEKSARIAKDTLEIQTILDLVNKAGRIIPSLETIAINRLSENLASLKTEYLQQAANPAATKSPAVPVVMPTQAAPANITLPPRDQAVKIITEHARGVAGLNSLPSLPEQQKSLTEAYRLLKNIPDNEKSREDLTRILNCANMLGDVLHKQKDPRALDIVQKMGINYCDQIIANNNYFRNMRSEAGTQSQFSATPAEMQYYVFARADAFEKIGKIHLEQHNPKMAAASFAQAKSVCENMIPERNQGDRTRIERYEKAERTALALAAQNPANSQRAIYESLLSKTQLNDLAAGKTAVTTKPIDRDEAEQTQKAKAKPVAPTAVAEKKIESEAVTNIEPETPKKRMA